MRTDRASVLHFASVDMLPLPNLDNQSVQIWPCLRCRGPAHASSRARKRSSWSDPARGPSSTRSNRRLCAAAKRERCDLDFLAIVLRWSLLEVPDDDRRRSSADDDGRATFRDGDEHQQQALGARSRRGAAEGVRARAAVWVGRRVELTSTETTAGYVLSSTAGSVSWSAARAGEATDWGLSSGR